MTKKQIFKIILFTSTAISLYFVPWILVKAWISPLPDTVQEQVDETIGHGFDGNIYPNVGLPCSYSSCLSPVNRTSRHYSFHTTATRQQTLLNVYVVFKLVLNN